MIRSTLKDKRFFHCSKVIEFADCKEKRQQCQCSVWNESRGFKRQCEQQDMLILSQFVKQFLSEIIFYNLKISRHFVLNYSFPAYSYTSWIYGLMLYVTCSFSFSFFFGNVSNVKLAYNLQSSGKSPLVCIYNIIFPALRKWN